MGAFHKKYTVLCFRDQESFYDGSWSINEVSYRAESEYFSIMTSLFTKWQKTSQSDLNNKTDNLLMSLKSTETNIDQSLKLTSSF